jgi:hypothetical protein
MKTSKKFLSLFLALVMIITSCSVGLTAFAADGNKTDTNNNYWSSGTDAEAAFDSLNNLVDAYIPQLLQIDSIKKLLENKLGMTVTDTTTISDVVAGASPLLLGLLGGTSADKATIRKDSSPMADIYYSYLDEDGSVMDFYSLYSFCESNLNSSNSELKEYCNTTYEKLQTLLGVYKTARQDYQSKYNASGDACNSDKYVDAVFDQLGEDFESWTYEGIKNVDIDGTPLSEVKDPDCDFFLNYFSALFSAVGSDVKVENLADFFYYAYTEEGYLAFYNETLLPLAKMGGATVSKDDIALNSANDKFYNEETKGVLVYTGLYTLDEINSMAITDEQIEKFVADAVANQYNRDQFISYLNSSDCAFSKPVAKYINAMVGASRNDGQMMKWLNLARDNDIEGVKSFTYTRGTTKFEENNFTFLEQANYMYPSELIRMNVGSNYDVSSDAYEAVDVQAIYVLFNEYFTSVKPTTSKYQYHYSDYAVPDDLIVEATNDTLDSLLAQYLAPGSLVAGLVDVNELIAAFTDTDITLYSDDGTGALNDLWLNLYNQPVETIFKLLPTVTVVLEEVVMPLLFNGDDDFVYIDLGNLLLTHPDADVTLYPYSQEAGSDIGIGDLSFDLNKVVPAVLHWLVGDESTAYDLVGHYEGDVYDNNVPVFTNIFVADKALYNAKIGTYNVEKPGLSRTIYKALAGDEKDSSKLKNYKSVAIGLDEAVTELATFAMDAVDEYLAEHSNDLRYYGKTEEEAEVTQRGLNNIFVALPQIIDTIGQNFIKKYNIDSDWTYTYNGKITTVSKEFKDGTVEQLQNNTLQAFKDTATSGDPSQVLNVFVNILIGNWLNGALDIVNDVFSDENNDITSKLPLVQGLLAALGGFGETSVITDVVNGLFQLKRSDTASFTLEERSETGFVGFSNESGFYLLSNIQFDKDGEARGLVPVILSLINNKSTSNDYKFGNAVKSSSPTLASSKKSAAGTDYSKLLTSENTAAAQTLIDTIDELLSSLLSNTSLNGFDWDSTDNILSSIATFASAYFGAENTNAIVKLLNNYLYFVVGENKATTSKNGKIGTSPTSSGDVDAKKVYTSANLSNLVIQTYSLIENLVDYLFYNSDTGLLTSRDPNMLIADALYGIISPDAVAVRLSDDYSKTADILLKKDNANWNSFKVQITQANNTKGTWSKDYLKFGFKNGDKTAFYDALGESLNGIAAIVGVILTDTYTNSSKTSNWYSEIIYPVLNSVATATGATGVMSPKAFNKATDSQKLIKGILTPISSILDQIYDAPLTFVLNLVKGLAGVLQDSYVKKIVNGAIDPINYLLDGVVGIVNYISPTLAKVVENALDGGISVTLPKKNIVMSLINSLVGSVITLPNINWNKLATAKSPAEVLLLVYGYVVDVILDSELIQTLLDKYVPQLTTIIKNLSATEILDILNEVLAVVQSPTEVYWTFSQYAAKLMNKFYYPTGVTASEADDAVDQLDDLVANVFPLLQGLGVADIDGLKSLVNDNLYTNEILTTLATSVYGAIESSSSVSSVLSQLGMDLSTTGIAAYLMDSSYGKTFSSAASTLKKAKSWKSVKSLNWGFTNGSAKAQTGFVNGLAAILRPINNILSIFLAEGEFDLSSPSNKKLSKDDIVKLVKTLELDTTKLNLGSGEYGCTLKIFIKKGVLNITVQSNVKTANKKNNVVNVFKVDLPSIVKDLLNSDIETSGIGIGTNGYESAIIPLLEAFMCDGVKTYKQYQSDYNKAKDNLLIDIINPVLDFVGDVCDKPFDTITKVLPNVAYFIDSNGLAQAVSNLLAPITAENGLIGILDNHGLNVDDLIESIVGKDLGTLVTDALGLKVDLNLELTHLEKCNIQDIVLPLVKKLLKSAKVNITIPDFTFEEIASHGTIKTVKSAAKNSDGKYTTKQVEADQGEVLVAVLRYVSDLLIKNASSLKSLLCNIDAIKKNSTIANIIKSVFNQIGSASKDDIVLAVFYLLTEDATDKFFDYTDFKYDDSYEFSFGNMDEDFCRQLAPMLDGLVSGLLESKGGLNGLISGLIYKDDIISSIATGLYGAVEGVKINDSIGSLTSLLAKTDIDFSTSNVASLLTDKAYGTQYTAAASVIKSAGSWSKVNKDDLKWGVTDRDSFMNALCAVLRPLYGVLDVILNDASLNLFDLIKLPGSDGYSSTIVPLLEAFGVYNVKTQYQYREDIFEAYDNILLDIINPLWDKVEDILNAPIEMIADILPNLSLFFANDGLLQIVENLLTPISALLDALKPIVDVNDILVAAGLDIPKVLKEKVGISISKFDIYDLSGTLAPLVGADNVVSFLNDILGIIKISGNSLGIELPDIDWFKLASHGDFVLNATSQAATFGSRISVTADQDETLIAVLRFLIDTINYKGNYDAIVNLIGGLLGNVSDSVSQVIDQVLGMLQGDSDTVIEKLVDLLQSFA